MKVKIEQRVVQYVLDNGRCTAVSIFREFRNVNLADMRRYLARGAPEGLFAYEKGSRREGYTFVLAELPPEGFVPIEIRGRNR